MREPRWDEVCRYVEEKLNDATLSLRHPFDHMQTTHIRGFISACEEILRLPEIMTAEEMEGDRTSLPPNEDFIYGR